MLCKFLLTSGRAFSYLVDLSNLLVIVNSSANFIIYYTSGETFRKTLHSIIRSRFSSSSSHRSGAVQTRNGGVGGRVATTVEFSDGRTAETPLNSSSQYVSNDKNFADNPALFDNKRTLILCPNENSVIVRDTRKDSNRTPVVWPHADQEGLTSPFGDLSNYLCNFETKFTEPKDFDSKDFDAIWMTWPV